MADFSVTYTATRGLIAGHAIDSQQTFSCNLKRLDITDDISAYQTLTPSDAETELESIVSVYDLETQLLDDATKLACREFLLSTAASESFTFSLQGGPNQTGQLLLIRKLRPFRAMANGSRYRFKVREQN